MKHITLFQRNILSEIPIVAPQETHQNGGIEGDVYYARHTETILIELKS